ncbi:hypothetical protein [Alistipes senegalensis]|uniref:hypothetical protein n=1 Tax=Alistipes senegalensis TaxID=1288121 RepID=UPI00242C454E|nr:hypothetical protein [Alistipes senegalensis]MCI7308683.1 hypothetical protein [Alistipes senegalensis]MDD7039529.1 hypothetical protein [Alistipes senegalensis]MDY2875700.1 hypothetical protein [Alistipes senegalensis]MDY5240185.1 hypothetical protein [Alistipes senegalensis]
MLIKVACTGRGQHQWTHRLCAMFHCRTAYSYSRYYYPDPYTPTGYILNYWKTGSENDIRRVDIHMRPQGDLDGMVEINADEREKYGRAGVFCVRNVK